MSGAFSFGSTCPAILGTLRVDFPHLHREVSSPRLLFQGIEFLNHEVYASPDGLAPREKLALDGPV
ncbi:hypothetical protein DRO42_07750 [Candidatus Bathyarchaeota archaeon]|nr:MAG: hypothetical protein DRO42_07750 [Candidatus Bathyarchaeota archaeon]